MDDIWQALGMLDLLSMFVCLIVDTSYDSRRDRRNQQVETFVIIHSKCIVIGTDPVL